MESKVVALPMMILLASVHSEPIEVLENTDIHLMVVRTLEYDNQEIIDVKHIDEAVKHNIKLHQGFSLPITKYAPDTVIEELMEFADKNAIPVKKTKDFMVLEKWNM